MLFNSYTFIFLFLPFAVGGYYACRHYLGYWPSLLWLALSSLVFYGAWDWRYVLLICGSALFNFYTAVGISRRRRQPGRAGGRALLVCGIALNLCLLGYYKYLNFFVDNLNLLIEADIFIQEIVLPIGISFFTFQQIAYLVDCYRREASDYNLVSYLVFVTFFPQLIAGPIVHHKEMMPQFQAQGRLPVSYDNFSCGVIIFMIGLFKKIVIADQVALIATPVFQVADLGGSVTLLDAWFGVLAYTFQIYFDFSAYSDMAVGLALLFNIHLPVNFYSPYKATSIIDFWRRWHMTLSRFLRDYLYIPLGGNRAGEPRRYVNIMATMVLGGIWHGAGWTFFIWGALHGVFLVVNHLWRALAGGGEAGGGFFARWGGRLLTFFVVVVAWAFFRAETVAGAYEILRGMAGLNGISVDPAGWLGALARIDWLNVKLDGDIVFSLWGAAQLVGCLAFVWLLPNTYQLMADKSWLSRLAKRLRLAKLAVPAARETLQSFRAAGVYYPVLFPTALAAPLAAVLFYYVIASLNKPSEFIYFQF